MIKLKKLIIEAGKIDRMYVKKSFDKFHRISEPSNDEWKALVISIIKNLGFKPTKHNVEDLEHHLHIIYSANDRFIRSFPDMTDFKEMYELLS